jgi:hypothetical protein
VAGLAYGMAGVVKGKPLTSFSDIIACLFLARQSVQGVVSSAGFNSAAADPHGLSWLLHTVSILASETWEVTINGT